jgi:hypothetical protein
MTSKTVSKNIENDAAFQKLPLGYQALMKDSRTDYRLASDLELMSKAHAAKWGAFESKYLTSEAFGNVADAARITRGCASASIIPSSLDQFEVGPQFVSVTIEQAHQLFDVSAFIKKQSFDGHTYVSTAMLKAMMHLQAVGYWVAGDPSMSPTIVAYLKLLTADNETPPATANLKSIESYAGAVKLPAARIPEDNLEEQNHFAFAILGGLKFGKLQVDPVVSNFLRRNPQSQTVPAAPKPVKTNQTFADPSNGGYAPLAQKLSNQTDNERTLNAFVGLKKTAPKYNQTVQGFVQPQQFTPMQQNPDEDVYVNEDANEDVNDDPADQDDDPID